MILTTHKNELKTNVKEIKSQNFGIGNASVIIDILRNKLYEHKIRTLVQEYLCNARDAMREVNNKDPLKVTIPNKLSPTFKVRDFGPGISPERMQNVFVLYGASTKRADNTQTGGFGIGAKSAWSYTDSFTIITYIDSIKRTYIAHTGVNNNGRLDLIDTINTTKLNGTEIQIAVNPNDINEFQASIYRAVYFWDIKPDFKGVESTPSLDLNNDYKIENLTSVHYKELPDFLQGYNSDMLMIVDGIPYVINHSLLSKCPDLSELKSMINNKLIIHIDTGLIEIAASRESIADSDKTVQGINRIASQLINQVKLYLNTEFKKVTSVFEFITTYKLLSTYFDVSERAKYKNYSISYNTIKNELFSEIKITQIHNITKSRKRSLTKIYRDNIKYSSIALNQFENLYYLNTDETKVIQNRRIREFLLNEEGLVLFECKDNSSAFKRVCEELNIKNFTTLTYPIKPKTVNTYNPRISLDKTEFCVHHFDYSSRASIYTTIKDNDQKWLYLPMTKGAWETYNSHDLAELDRYFKENTNYRICGLGIRSQKLVTNDSNFSPLNNYISNFKPNTKEYNGIKIRFRNNIDEIERIKKLKGLKDKFLIEMVKEYENIVTASRLPDILFNIFKDDKEVKDFTKRDKTLTETLTNKYLLLDSIYSYRHNLGDEIVIYMNAKYKRSK